MLSCTKMLSVETGLLGEPGLFLERFVMCTWERRRKGVLGLQPVGSQQSAVHASGTCDKPHSKELSIGKAVTIFGFYKSMTRDARGRERRLSRGSLHRHQVLMEPGHLFTSPESWTPWDWQSPLNRAPTHSARFFPLLQWSQFELCAIWIANAFGKCAPSVNPHHPCSLWPQTSSSIVHTHSQAFGHCAFSHTQSHTVCICSDLLPSAARSLPLRGML